MSENFPFDTADDFLNEFREKPVSDQIEDVQPDASIHVPVMPDVTDVQKGARLAGIALLGVGAITQDRWVLIAAIAAIAVIECFRLYSDLKLRGFRNARLGDENIAAMQSAAQVKSTFLENQ